MKIRIHTTTTGKAFFAVLTANGKQVCESGYYANVRNARDAAKLLKSNVAYAEVTLA